ncbi:AAA domain-containing protein [Plesiocystis pacifica]|uniref:AAA domain-containing protein n=1 Tax=Plesiocystis pacifica TaxID=191768 RepID=UPI0005D46C99|nr:AAA domain-containing protein [Plesiocystis pacifica]
MSQLNYMALTGVGRWDRALKDVGAQLKPYDNYLWTAISAVKRHKPALAWRTPNKEEETLLNERLRARLERRNRQARQAERRRDRHQHATPTGVWVILEPPPWREDEPEQTFDDFLRAREVYQRPGTDQRASLEKRGWDVEARALLLDRFPSVLEPEQGSEHLAPTSAHPHGALLWLRPDIYNLTRQQWAMRALDNAPSRPLAPLIKLLTTQASWPRFEAHALSEQDWVFLRPATPGSALRDGTDEQRRFVEIAMGTPDFALLEGPPGSGKTTAICELIVQLARENKRVLLVASTNVAVDNVLERLIAWEEQLPEEDRFVLPVRIGDSGRISSDALEPFLHENIERTVRDDILDFLESGRGSEVGAQARSMLDERLRRTPKKERSELISRLVAESVNLVCGTPIGVLQHPEIKDYHSADRHHPRPRELFDVLIVDEASKTTFTEFLVPAIYARKWVIVGDIKQLSPYVESEDISQNLRRALQDIDGEAQAQAAARAYQATPRGQIVRSLIACDDDQARLLQIEARAKGTPYVDLDRCETRMVAGVPGVVPGLLYANLIFGAPDTLAQFEHRLPEDLDLVEGPLPSLHDLQRARAHARGETREQAGDWAHEYGWRLVRSYELRHNHSERAPIKKQLDELMPASLTEEASKKLSRHAENIRRVALPSILELLQIGFERLPGWDRGVTLNHGLPDEALSQRLVSLSFQHRMHPHISAFSRQHFYSDESTSRSTLLRDASTLERDWSYSRYTRRAVWIEVPRPRGRHGNRNPAEAEVVMRELEAFARWAQRQPGRRDGPWKVSILTFYRGQEAMLRDRLQRFTKQPGNTRNFAYPRKQPRVEITLCTVDRFQGHEADLVLLSFVKGGGRKHGSVGFLNSPNRLNVALTRARYQIALIGDRNYFAHCRSPLLVSLATSPHYATELAWEGDR